jgi:hypothetical protein
VTAKRTLNDQLRINARPTETQREFGWKSRFMGSELSLGAAGVALPVVGYDSEIVGKDAKLL